MLAAGDDTKLVWLPLGDMNACGCCRPGCAGGRYVGPLVASGVKAGIDDQNAPAAPKPGGGIRVGGCAGEKVAPALVASSAENMPFANDPTSFVEGMEVRRRGRQAGGAGGGR